MRHGLAAFLAEETMRLPGRAAPPANWHLTIRFLGPTKAIQKDKVLEFLDDHLVVEPFTLGFASLGAFPKPARASVLWLGVERGARELAVLAEIAEASAQAAGFEPEERPFHPHLTLSRMRPPIDVRGLIEQVPSFPLTMVVDRVTLYRSVMGQGPVRYETVDEILL